MLTFQVNSIPLKEVIISLAESLGIPYKNYCGEYYVDIPAHIGEGQIRGINFENGLGLITYKVLFKEDFRLEFTLNEVHPLKFIYSLRGPVSHMFPNEGIKRSIDEFKCAIVASEKMNGHIMEFSKNVMHEVISVEIDRKEFSEKERCELQSYQSELKDILTDEAGKNQFYHVDHCGIYYKDLLKNVEDYKNFEFGRKLNLQSITIQMFVNQLIQFDDDTLRSDQQAVLRIQELKRVEEAVKFIKENIAADLSIKNLSRLTGLNANKLQMGFQYLFLTTINEFVINERLEQSNHLLKNKEFNVQEVVAAVGLESSSYFSKIYKKKFGITPMNYRKIFM